MILELPHFSIINAEKYMLTSESLSIKTKMFRLFSFLKNSPRDFGISGSGRPQKSIRPPTRVNPWGLGSFGG